MKKSIKAKETMKRMIIMAAVAMMAVVTMRAQKIDQRLTQLVEERAALVRSSGEPTSREAVTDRINVKLNDDGTVQSMTAIATLKKGAECPTERLEQMGIRVRYVLGDMVALYVPADRLLQLEQIEEFSYVVADEKKHPMNDKAREASKVDQVADQTMSQTAGLPKAYTGQGVVLGVIDLGIDYNHAAFRNADGSTRIVKVIEYPGNVKKEYSTEAEIKSLTTDYSASSHGTHVSSTAGGSDVGNGLQGMAPETDLILCGLGSYASNSNVVECIKAVFDYATSVGKPAVVNISLGDYMGLHDGSDELARGIASLTENGTKPGRAVISSVGNAGSRFQSVVKPLATTTEELKTVLGANGYSTSYYPNGYASYRFRYLMYADDYQDFTPTLMLVNLKSGELVDKASLAKVGLEEDEMPVASKRTVKRQNGDDAIVYEFNLSGCSIHNADYRYALIVRADHDGQTIKMVCDGDNNGAPCFYAPASTDGSYDFAANGYSAGDGTIAFNTSVCDESVICAGAYVTRNKWTNYNGEEIQIPESWLTEKQQALGEILETSSYGIADNGVRCPTVIAPGKAIISDANSYRYSYLEKKDKEDKDDEEDDGPIEIPSIMCAKVDSHGRTNWYVNDGGTSMAAPMVAGIVALWMQANPELTVIDIRKVMEETCANDDWTTDTDKIPSHNRLQAGYGKIDALAGLKKILGSSTAIDVTFGDEQRQATPATMYRVDAPVYNLMGQRVDKSKKGIVVYKGRKYLNR